MTKMPTEPEAMERPKIVTSFDRHDHDQLMLLAKVNKITPSELVRRIIKAHLDKTNVKVHKE